ncbi:MAG: DUF1570 domain-containing protein, partial [Planctomycetota bacterium]
VSLEPFWKDVTAKEGAAKTGEDWFQISLLLEKEGFDKGTWEERLKKAIAVDPNHEKARKKLGYVKRTNERGESVWLDAKKAKDFDATSGAIKKDAAAQEERPWGEYRIVVRMPANKPEYEIVTNLPKDHAEDYASFMVQLKNQLVSLIEKEVYGKSGKKIAWIPNPCKVCKGSKGNCARCGGSGEEPCTVFLTNTHKMFMDLNPTPGMGGYFMPGPFPPGDRQESYGFITCDRPIVAFHGQFGGTGNTFMVLAHEGTHQLQAKMWKGDASSLHYRPGWLTEGLACVFGDGLVIGAPDKKTGAREMRVDIARDRLAALKRRLKQAPNTPGNYPLKQFTNFGIREFQQDAGLYSFGWSLIYFMLNAKEKFKFGGKEIDLKEAFGTFFADNCEKGAVEQYRGSAALGLAKALGVTNGKDAEQCLDELEKVWRDYVLKLPIKAVGDFDAKDKKKWISPELKFELTLPGGKKKPKFNWSLVSPEDLNSVIFEEAMSFTDGNARVVVGVHANAENYDIDDSVDFLYRGLARSGYGRFASTEPTLMPPSEGKPDERPAAVEGTLAGSGIETRTVTFKAKERTIKGYVENVRPKQQQVKMLVCRTAAKIYQVILMADEDEWAKYEGELNEILASFAVTGG